MNKGVIIGVLVALIILGGVGGGIYVANKSRPSAIPVVTPTEAMPLPTSGPVVEKAVEGVATDEAKIKIFNVVESSYEYNPSSITVNLGDKVRINYTVEGSLPHNFNIDELNVVTKQMANGSGTVEFVADKKGTFDFYCSVGNHRTLGMVGKLVVQ
ncbi:MAG: cupredoxin domain-containing protein [bacterium]|nr:cupredoxin domain-containing protein [bacterium]